MHMYSISEQLDNQPEEAVECRLRLSCLLCVSWVVPVKWSILTICNMLAGFSFLDTDSDISALVLPLKFLVMANYLIHFIRPVIHLHRVMHL